MTQPVEQIAHDAKAASRKCAAASLEIRNNALRAMASSLRAHCSQILAANAQDMNSARNADTKESLLDRLMLNEERVESMAQGLEALVSLPDPLGVVQVDRVLDSGVHLQRVSVPMGLVVMVYEARPNVTSDSAGICIKSGNACVLRGGSLAFNSCLCIARYLHEAAVSAGMPRNCIRAVETADRSDTDKLLRMRGTVDLLIPRGGAGLISHCVETATVPVVETGTGNCHVYVHDPADINMARNIVVNAKTQRTGVCNACESLLVDRSIAYTALPVLLRALQEHDVALHVDEETAAIAAANSIDAVPANEYDWGREYLDLDISVKIVSGLEEAIDHINRYGTGHSECIVTEDGIAARTFQEQVDAACVYWNASTRFSDGGEFGLGAEIGISTQKMHVRGPFALEALTTYKYFLSGNGQVRS